MSLRPSYDESDTIDRNAHLASRSNVSIKTFATNLWMRVISRAIDDIALYEFMREVGRELKDEEQECEASAVGFLFSDEHRVPIDDYLIDILCQKCGMEWESLISKVAGTSCTCPLCGNKTTWQYTTYEIVEDQEIKDISLQDLISLLGVEDIEAFRDGCNKKIDSLVNKRLSTYRRAPSSIRNKSTDEVLATIEDIETINEEIEGVTYESRND
jgi:hypothetical protein